MSYEQHKKDLFGHSDMKKVAEAIGDLHYETLAILLHYLSQKIHLDAINDYKNGRTKLSIELDKSQLRIFEASLMIRKAWQISKPFMKQ